MKQSRKLMPCPACGHNVSRAAPTCPACGQPIRVAPARAPRKKSAQGTLVAIGTVLTLIGVVVAALSGAAGLVMMLVGIGVFVVGRLS